MNTEIMNAVTESAQTEEEEEERKKVSVTGTMSIYFPQIRSYVLRCPNY